MGDRRIVAEAGSQSRAGGRSVGRVAMISLHTSPTASLGRNANGGLNVYVREVCNEFSSRGIASDVFTRRVDAGRPTLEQLTPWSRVVYLPAGDPTLDKYRLLGEVGAFTNNVESFIADEGLAYDLIYSHYWLSGVSACTLRSRLRLPWVHTAHTLAVVKNRQLAPGAAAEPEIRADLEGEIARCADLLVVSTEAEADDLRGAYHLPRDRLAVVAPGVNLDVFRAESKQQARLRLGHGDHRLFVFVGRLEPLKGVDIVLRAFARLTADGRHPAARLLVLGEDSGAGECARLQRLVTKLGLSERVEFLGSIPQCRLPTYYAAAEACLIPSYSESFGLVGLEAQACGTAVIASNVAGLASVVRDGVTGFLVDGHDPADYAERMCRVLETTHLSEELGWRGSRLARAFSWERTADQLLQRFSELVSGAAVPVQLGVQATSRTE